MTDTLNTAPAPAANAPTLSSSAMLVELSISTWTGRKKDKRATAEIIQANNAQARTANVIKRLMGDNPHLDAVQKFAGNTRNMHYAMTMPWSDLGLRLLATKQYFDYHQQMTTMQAEYERLVLEFLNGYDWDIAHAQAKLGGFWRSEDYPTADSLSNKFKFRMSYLPIPEAGDFRVDISNQANAEIAQHYDDYYERQINTALNDVWTRLHKVLTNMSDRLDYADHTDKTTRKTFRDTLVENVTSLLPLLEICNATGDVQKVALRDKLEDALTGITPDALRDDDYLRRVTKEAVDDVLKSMPTPEDDTPTRVIVGLTPEEEAIRTDDRARREADAMNAEHDLRAPQEAPASEAEVEALDAEADARLGAMEAVSQATNSEAEVDAPAVDDTAVTIDTLPSLEM